MPGAQTNSYNNAINQFYQALEDGASAAGGTPPPQTGNSGSGANAIWDPYNPGGTGY